MSFLISDFFDLDKIEKIKEGKTKVHFYTHKKTKAQVLFFDNANENAGFSTFFKTPCENSKGTTHILEHSVFAITNSRRNCMPTMQQVSKRIACI